MLGRPADAVDKTDKRQVPDLDRIKARQYGKRKRACKRYHDHRDQRIAPFETIGRDTDKSAEQTHRNQPQHGQHGDDEDRPRELIREQAKGQHFEPADQVGDKPDEPEPPEVGECQQACGHGADARPKSGNAAG